MQLYVNYRVEHLDNCGPSCQYVAVSLLCRCASRDDDFTDFYKEESNVQIDIVENPAFSQIDIYY